MKTEAKHGECVTVTNYSQNLENSCYHLLLENICYSELIFLKSQITLTFTIVSSENSIHQLSTLGV